MPSQWRKHPAVRAPHPILVYPPALEAGKDTSRLTRFLFGFQPHRGKRDACSLTLTARSVLHRPAHSTRAWNLQYLRRPAFKFGARTTRLSHEPTGEAVSISEEERCFTQARCGISCAQRPVRTIIDDNCLFTVDVLGRPRKSRIPPPPSPPPADYCIHRSCMPPSSLGRTSDSAHT